MSRNLVRAGLIPALFICQPALAEPRLAMPIDCRLGDTCYIQNYVDRDPGPGVQDFTCAGLSYDGHKGTDFALPSLAAIATGVRIRAAAAGIVKGARDGMIDKPYTPEEDARIAGRDCGNGLVLSHGDGWETQYCHMRQGSVRVRTGQLVDAGEVLGQVGMSGRTQFPHLHISVRREGEVVDPFTPDAPLDGCRTGESRTLWSDPITYQPGGVIAAGFSIDVPAYTAIKAGTAGTTDIATDVPSLVLWGYAYGGRQGDVMELRIDGPEGELFATRQLIKKDLAQFFRAGGKRLRAPLPAGLYQGVVTLIRKGETIDRRSTTVTVN